MCACTKSVSSDLQTAMRGDSKSIRNEVEQAKDYVRIHLTSKQCTLTAKALLSFMCSLITCSDGVRVYFVILKFKQDKSIPVPAGR